MPRQQNVDCAAVLRGILWPMTNGVPPEVRAREVDLVKQWWPREILKLALRHGAAWHALTEPPHWEGFNRSDICAFVVEFAHRKGRWPTIDEQRRRFGHLPTDRMTGEDPNQTRLAV